MLGGWLLLNWFVLYEFMIWFALYELPSFALYELPSFALASFDCHWVEWNWAGFDSADGRPSSGYQPEFHSLGDSQRGERKIG